MIIDGMSRLGGFMKKAVVKWWLVLFIVGLNVFAESNLPWDKECLAAGPQPMMMAATPVIKSSEISNVILMGTGFKPGEDIYLHIVTMDGQQADITYALKPTPKADKTGTWSTTWNAKDYVQTKLVTDGAYKITVTDIDLRLMTHTLIFFQLDSDQKGKEKGVK
jgi:hypothetical protein